MSKWHGVETVRFAKDATQLIGIGNKHLLQLNHISQESGCVARILVKLEGMNPSAAVKYRIAMSIIAKAERMVLI